MIDTEGHDAKIIRSMIQHCKEQDSHNRCAWPDVIQFETCGVCDENEGEGTELAALRQLVSDGGYFLVMKQWMNTIMIRQKAVDKSPHLRRWLDESYCDICSKKNKWPLILVNDDIMYCKSCLPPGVGPKETRKEVSGK